MALKEKIIDKAQKFIQKGYLDKAIVEYRAALDIDPKDVAIRLRLGELYVKVNKTNDAIKEYTEVAKANAQRGFYLKAIAVYKQILKLDDSLEVHYKLADLYTKQRLIADAVGEYSFIVSTFEKKGKTSEVLELLKKMIDIDPDNIGIRLRLAELYHKLAFDKDALSEYSSIFAKLVELGKLDKAEKVFLGLYNSYPGEPVVLKGLSDLYGRKGDTGQFYKYASPLFRVYRDSGDTEAARELSGEILRVRPGDADCLKFMERFNLRGAEEPVVQESVSTEEVSGVQPESWTEERTPQAKEAEEPASLPEEEIEITVEGFEEEGAEVLEGAPEALREEALSESAPEASGGEESRAEAEAVGAEVKEEPSVEVSQEAEVEIELPGVDEPAEAENAGPEEKNSTAAVIEAEAAAQEPQVEIEISPEPEAAEPPVEEISVEAGPEAEVAIEETSVPVSEPEVEVSAAAEEAAEEISVEAGPEVEVAIEEAPASVSDEVQVSAPVEEAAEEIRVEAGPEAEATIEEPAAAAENIEVQPVEEEFSEGSLEEALEEAIEEVNLKISESGEDQITEEPQPEPVQEEEETPAVSIEERPEVSAEVLVQAVAEVESETSEEPYEAAAEPEPEPEPEPVAELEPIAEPEPETEPEPVQEPEAEPEPDIPAVAEHAQSAAAEAQSAPLIENISPDEMLLEPEKLKMEATPEAGKGEDYVDLSAELGMEETIQDLAGSWGGGDSKEAYDEFKNGIGQQLSKEDTETHYNLGIAYMEMELYSEASKEFKIALKDPHLEFDCLIRLGLSAVAEGDSREAIAYYLKGLRVEGRSTTERMGMMYELALAYEAAGERDEASRLFNSIYDADPGYREVADKVAFAAPRAVIPLIPLDDGLIEVELL